MNEIKKNESFNLMNDKVKKVNRLKIIKLLYKKQ